MSIRLEYNVKLTATHCRLAAPLAIWSAQHSGLYFPADYYMNGKNKTASGFLRVTSKGYCEQIIPAPPVEYVDMLETVENQLFQSLPLSVRLLFGFMGNSTDRSQ
jgi:hypothetical protein